MPSASSCCGAAITFVICVLITKSCSAYEIPSVKLDLLNNGFTLSLTGEPGIKKVLYVVNINGKCPGFMDIIFEPQTVWTTSQLSTPLSAKDKLNISILVDYNGEAYRSSQYIVVGENNNKAVVAATNPTPGQQNKCVQNPVQPGNCEPAQTVVPSIPNICKNQLVFEENFDGTEVDTQKWSFDVRTLLTGRHTEEFALYDSQKENIFLVEGVLNIKPTFTRVDRRSAAINFGSRCTPVENVVSECKLMTQLPLLYVPPVNSSNIHTRSTFKFKYGRVEIRAKLPKGDWLLPYIILQNYGNFDKKQIRIAFARGNEELMTTLNGTQDIGGRRLYGGIVKDVDEYDTNFKEHYGSEHFGDNFHIYTMTWSKDKISMAVDGVTFGEIHDNLNEFNEEFFISLGVSAGGHLEFPDSLVNPAEKPWQNTSPKALGDFWQSLKDGKITWTGDSQKMQIDYVRVYAV